jgi:hypothetical protein
MCMAGNSVLHPDVGPAEEAGPNECGGGPGGQPPALTLSPCMAGNSVLHPDVGPAGEAGPDEC